MELRHYCQLCAMFGTPGPVWWDVCRLQFETCQNLGTCGSSVCHFLKWVSLFDSDKYRGIYGTRKAMAQNTVAVKFWRTLDLVDGNYKGVHKNDRIQAVYTYQALSWLGSSPDRYPTERLCYKKRYNRQLTVATRACKPSWMSDTRLKCEQWIRLPKRAHLWHGI